ncbi:MAG: hypothetical protein RLY71_3708 [Pseudomonadota bacterium]|jgi:hypothetical protein
MKKTQRVEIQRWKSAFNTVHNQVLVGFDAVFIAETPREDREPSHVLAMDETEARTLLALLKAQLGEFDKKKARSQR